MRITVLGVLFTLSISVQAMQLEPTVAYQAGKADAGDVSGKSSLNGASFGGKLGLQSGKFEAGIDAIYGVLEQEFAGQPRVLHPATHKQLGAYLAWDTMTFRAWSSFYFINDLDFTNRNEQFTGYAAKVGIGVPMVESVHANFDFIMHKFTEMKSAAGTTTQPDFELNTVMLSLSYLFSI